MFCKNCGAKIAEDSLFCNVCGAKQNITDSQPEELLFKEIMEKKAF